MLRAVREWSTSVGTSGDRRAAHPPLRGLCELGLTGTLPSWLPHGCRSALRRPLVFLLSSVTEGISLTLLEMAAGLPVVATDVGGNREVSPTASRVLVRPPHGLLSAV
jgi:hypothetical protein